MSRFPSGSYKFGPFTVDATKRLLFREGQTVSLTPKAFDTLLVLVANYGEVVDKDELMHQVWPDTIVEEGGLTRNISVLRKILGEKSDEHQYIVTIPGRGYTFVADVRKLPDRMSQNAFVKRCPECQQTYADATIKFCRKDGSPLDSVAVPSSESETKIFAPARAGDVSETFSKRITADLRPETKYAPGGDMSASGKLRGWIAVLPFKELGTDVKDAYLGLGIADSLITKLSNVGSLMIRPTSAVRRYAGADLDPLAVGRELRVDSVLEGSIQRLHERIRVTVQLVSAADGASIWADKFDGAFADVFAIEDHVSERVAESLVPRLSGNQRELLKKHYTENTEAYQAYLKGRFYSDKWTPEGFKKEIESFNQAIRIDPTYALAYVGLADAYYRASTVYLSPAESLSKMKAAAMKALEIDGSIAEAHASLGVAKEYCDWNWIEAENEFKRSIELNPNYAMGRLWYGLYLMEMGRLEESIAEIQKARELDPLSLEVNAFLALLPFNCARQYDRAEEQLRKTIEMESRYPQAHYFLGWVLEQQGRFDEAIAEYQTAMEFGGRFPLALAALGHACGQARRVEETQSVLGELTEMARRQYVSPYDIALVHLGLGEKDLAFAWLEKAFDERSVWMVRLKVDLRLEPLYGDARFRELLQRVGVSC